MSENPIHNPKSCDFPKVEKYVKVVHFDICIDFIKEGGGKNREQNNILSTY